MIQHARENQTVRCSAWTTKFPNITYNAAMEKLYVDNALLTNTSTTNFVSVYVARFHKIGSSCEKGQMAELPILRKRDHRNF